NGTLKAEWPHLNAITDPALLRAELDDVRTEYNASRLHSGIGYVTPLDEHTGRGEAIRAARRQGLAQAARQRLAYHRDQRKNQPNPEDPDVV
ncbi:integrase core domain-containing protein, partial [Ornithinimicrobium sp. LYQ103]|uniref:integrase core domain-containing protein n=2 Tax=unclassified Ornithinimicrobium TaxID=2615080 RepID=UPI003851BAAE